MSIQIYAKIELYSHAVARDGMRSFQGSQEYNELNSLAQSHFISEQTPRALLVNIPQPLHSYLLVTKRKCPPLISKAIRSLTPTYIKHSTYLLGLSSHHVRPHNLPNLCARFQSFYNIQLA